MKTLCFLGIVTALALSGISNSAEAAISGTTRVASGLGNPLFATYAPGDKNHLVRAGKGWQHQGGRSPAHRFHAHNIP